MNKQDILRILSGLHLDYAYYCDAGPHAGQWRIRIRNDYISMDDLDQLLREIRRYEKYNEIQTTHEPWEIHTQKFHFS